MIRAMRTPSPTPTQPRLHWPLPALLTWGACWVCWLGLRAVGVPPLTAMFTTTALGAICALPQARRWRRLMVAGGYPLSFAALGAASVPAWAWLLPLALLALIYPLRAWRDAPLFPTPQGALQGLEQAVPLAEGAVVLDAGCGLGDGLIALRSVYPQARLRGTEWSWPLCYMSRLRCRWAHISRADMWSDDWRENDLVYLFQRPESMGRAGTKAVVELKPGAWLVSLEFPLPDSHEDLIALPKIQAGDKPVWIYQRR